jgi:IclR family KDG regulon transcriptional repressor
MPKPTPNAIDSPATPNVPEDAKPTGTAAFSKFLAVLQCIADAQTPPGIAQLTALAGYPRPTVYRIVGALIAEGLVVEGPHGGAYSLGPRLLSLASRSWERSDLRVAASEPLQVLRDATRETVHLAVRSGSEMVYIEKLESPHAVRMASRIGTRVTLYSSSVGKAYLSSLKRAERDALLAPLNFVYAEYHRGTFRARRRTGRDASSRLLRGPRGKRRADLLLWQRDSRIEWRTDRLREHQHPAV